MNYTNLLFGDEARSKVLKGARTLADALRVTLGPRSKSVLIARKWGTPAVCDDGVTIAKAIHLRDPEEDLGAQMLREAAARTGDVVGDGTTTSTLLAHAILAEGVRNAVAGASAMSLRRGLMRALPVVVEALRRSAKPVETRAAKAQVATISAHGDRQIGELVAEAIEKVGGEGVVSVEEAKGIDTSLELVEGLRFDRGYLSPYFVTNGAREEAVLENPVVLLYDKRIGNMADLIPLLEAVVREGRSLLVVAEDVEGEALATLVVNKLRGTLPCAAVKAPGFGDRRKEMLIDIATLTGGRLVSEERGSKLANVTLEDLGKASRAIIKRDTTTIVGGGGNPAAIADRRGLIRRQLEETTSDYDREKLQERLAKLTGGVAVIRVGAPSEAELKTRKEAFDDAIAATQAAVVEGIVAGGGVALVQAAAALDPLLDELEGDERTGARVLHDVLDVPARQLATNAGVDPGVAAERIRAGNGVGLDASSLVYCDMVEAGIVDAVKVVRTALENAVSIAGVMLLAEATLTEHEEKSAEKTGAGEPEM